MSSRKAPSVEVIAKVRYLSSVENKSVNYIAKETGISNYYVKKILAGKYIANTQSIEETLSKMQETKQQLVDIKLKLNLSQECQNKLKELEQLQQQLQEIEIKSPKPQVEPAVQV